MVGEIEELIKDKHDYYRNIYTCRYDIAELREQKANKKAPLWEKATGTVDAKKDYIKSVVADIDSEIACKEADIELYYNLIRNIDDMIELEYLKDE